MRSLHERVIRVSMYNINTSTLLEAGLSIYFFFVIYLALDPRDCRAEHVVAFDVSVVVDGTVDGGPRGGYVCPPPLPRL